MTLRNWITAAAWRLYLWGIGMNNAEYLASIDRTYAVLKQCPTCGRPMSLVCWKCEESE